MQTILKGKKWKEYDYLSKLAVDVVCEATGGSLDILVNNAGIGKVWCFLREKVYYFFPTELQPTVYHLF
jgi:NAD(P)-dependent dehydrogenase (short-subunit alcohol dehydrogenase family)